jgi:hypothetical protein
VVEVSAEQGVYTLTSDELAYVEACIQTSKLLGEELRFKVDEGLRVQVGDAPWSLPMGIGLNGPGSGVVELPDSTWLDTGSGPGYDPRD